MSEIEKKAPKSRSFFSSSLVFLLGISLGYTILERWHKAGKFHNPVIHVYGMSEETVKSNSAVLSFRILIDEKTPTLIYQKMKTNLDIAMNFLIKQGCSKKEITVLKSMSRDYHKNYITHGGTVTIQIKTDRVDAMHDLHDSIAQLADQGVAIDQIALNYAYHFSKDTRKDLLKKALWDAKAQAKNLAEEADSTLLKLRHLQEKEVSIKPTEISSHALGFRNWEDEISQRKSLYKKIHMTIDATWDIAPRST
jgi:hypothetical protein